MRRTTVLFRSKSRIVESQYQRPIDSGSHFHCANIPNNLTNVLAFYLPYFHAEKLDTIESVISGGAQELIHDRPIISICISNLKVLLLYELQLNLVIYSLDSSSR